MPHVGTPAVARAWRYHDILRSLQWAAGGIVKNRSSFVDHIDRDSLGALLDEAAAAGIPRPSSYGDLFHHVYQSPRLSGAVSRAVAGFEVFGGWQELTAKPGDYPGLWHRYDLRSAYLWSAMQGLPEPKSMRYSEHFGRKHGVYVAEVIPSIAAPYPFRSGGRVVVTSEEIDRYRLTVEKLHYGITWRDNVSTDQMLSAVMRWSCYKQVGRSFWGRWASNGNVGCETFRNGVRSKRWELPNNTFNPIWGHLVTGRIRARLYDVTRLLPTARVYVDSVVVQGELATGDRIGEWQKEDSFNGLAVRHINQYYSLSA